MIKMLQRVMIASLFYMAAGSAQTTSVPTTATGVEHILQARRHLQDSTTMKEACDSSVESLESVFGSASASMDSTCESAASALSGNQQVKDAYDTVCQALTPIGSLLVRPLSSLAHVRSF